MKKWAFIGLVITSISGSVALLLHQRLTGNPWFEVSDFWHHETFITIGVVVAISLIIGKYLGPEQRRQK